MLLQSERPNTSRKKAQVHKQDFTYQYDSKTITYSVWATDPGSSIKTIVFLGTVQIGKLPAWIAQHCPEGTAVVQGAPHWLAKDDGSDIPEFMHRFTEEALASILKTHRVKTFNIIADSQAAPGVLGILAEKGNGYDTRVSGVVLLQPLGLNASAFAGTAEERIDLFKKRIAKNFRHQLTSLVSDRRLLHNHRQILKTVGYDNPKSNAQYSAGLAYNAIEDLKKLRATPIRTIIICGASDEMFPPQEIQTTLQGSNLDIPIIVVPKVPHAPLATRQGMRLFNKAFEYLES